MSLRDLTYEEMRPGMPRVQVASPRGEGVWNVRVYKAGDNLRADIGPGGLDYPVRALMDMDWQFYIDETDREAGF